jgi:3-methyladenine DNA glycosylase AlkD
MANKTSKKGPLNQYDVVQWQCTTRAVITTRYLIIIVTLAPAPKEKEKSATDVAAIRISNTKARNFVSGDL